MLKIGPIARVLAIQFLIAGLFFFGATARGSERSSKTTIVDAASRYAKLDGSRVHYKSFGKGSSAVVFVHGWTCNMDFWRLQIPDVVPRARVIAIDLPGHGASDKPQINYTMDLFARAVDAVLQDAKVDKAVLVGHSMGTPVIREFYRKYPQKTLGLVIVDGPVRAFMDKKMMGEFLGALRGPDYKAQTSGFVDGMLGPQISPQLRDEIKKAMLSTPQHVAISAMEAMADESIWKEDKINVPVLAVLAKSPFWPADTEQYFRSIAPKLDYQMWEGPGHFLMMEKPKEFNEALLSFITRYHLISQ